MSAIEAEKPVIPPNAPSAPAQAALRDRQAGALPSPSPFTAEEAPSDEGVLDGVTMAPLLAASGPHDAALPEGVLDMSASARSDGRPDLVSRGRRAAMEEDVSQPVAEVAPVGV